MASLGKPFFYPHDRSATLVFLSGLPLCACLFLDDAEKWHIPLFLFTFNKIFS
ncbi:hypothetical protein D088_830050 [Salmonella enterica subsp. houtenae serovar 16:z4,z32:-- str. RKS3027]|nr:hypothetical protein D088_830050 [Salmonella enterica subsp. houtenae serovar 16:z4,z32:-- str. RKS3027]